MNVALKNPGSFRDPSGAVFSVDGVIYRQVNCSFAPDFEVLNRSGLYEELVGRGLLVPHEECSAPASLTGDPLCIIRPERIPFISYPHEWSFHQLKDAALCTLEIQDRAIARGMTLKDATAYNIQFRGDRPVSIDTLSFERLVPGAPWVAYRQFCQHFLAPLALMSRRDVHLSRLGQLFIDGVPLELASVLLPWRTRLRFGLQVHIHAHARMQRRFAGSAAETSGRRKSPQVGPAALRGLIESLRATVAGLEWAPGGTEWADYYDDTNYSSAGMDHKVATIDQWSGELQPKMVWDLGANTGRFSDVVANHADVVVACDVDPAAVDRNYLRLREAKQGKILPLVMDLTNPTPGFGWAGEERMSLTERGPADLAVALALVHHLAISNNVPLPMIAQFLSRCARHLIIEFVPKGDSQVRRLLSTRPDIFPEYTREGFEAAFGAYFVIERSEQVRDSERILYRMRAHATRPGHGSTSPSP